MESNAFNSDTDGSILSINVRNFLCHDNLEIKFNRNLNFIVGRNGSGKSAILTALVVGLGGRASATNRGTNLSSFIKKGTHSATIEIKIKNSSPRAYQHEIYGDQITIVRNITTTSAPYKIKSAAGEIISSKYQDVVAITLAHDIQVNNPVSILNQDDARSFHSTNAKKKYIFFRQATNLDQTENNYNNTIDNCHKASDKLQKKNEVFVELEKEYYKWKSIYEQLQSHNKMEELKKQLQNEYYWSEIDDLEHKATKIQTLYYDKKAQMERNNDMLEMKEQYYKRNNDNIQELNGHLNIISKQRIGLEQQLSLLQRDANTTTAMLRTAQNNCKKCSELLRREKNKIDDLFKAIQNVQSSAGDVGAQRAHLLSAAASAAESVEAARSSYSTAQREAEQARFARTHAVSLATSAVRGVQQLRDTIAKLEEEYGELESCGQDSLAVYGRNMLNLVGYINSMPAGSFSAPPKGPIGAYLKVKEKKWGGALEHIIGPAIQSFCVNTAEDSRKLLEIMAQVYGAAPKPSVTCSKFLPHAHDVSRTRVTTRHYKSALDTLDFSDHVVANFLVDNLHMETILLVPEHEETMRLLKTEGELPPTCFKIVTLDSTEFYPPPNYRSYGGNNPQSRYLHLSTAEKKRQLLENIEEKKIELFSLETNAKELSREAQNSQLREAAASKELQALLEQLHVKEQKQRDAAGELEDAQQAPQFEALVDDLNVARDEAKRYNAQLEELARKELELTNRSNDINNDTISITSQIQSLTDECSKTRDEIDQGEMKLEQELTMNKMIKQKLLEQATQLGQMETDLAMKRSNIDNKTKAALELCPKPASTRDLKTVINELQKNQIELKMTRREGLTKAQVTEKYLKLERKYRKDKKSLVQLEQIIRTLKETAKARLEFSHEVQIEIMRRVQHTFQSILAVRGYSGDIDIRNGEGVLEIQCSGRRGGTPRRVSSTASLSGGERSYSTVAFIMALWECVELPFCFMDEFDVFMDNVTRKMVMDILMDHALKNKSRQFVFLTPQDASSVRAGPHVSIYKLDDPRS